MTKPPFYLHLGPDAERVWAEYLRNIEAEAERLRNLQPEIPE
jgi:hypothetical protein